VTSARRVRREQPCGIERRQGRIRVIHDQRDLGAAEDDRVATLVLHPSDDPLKTSDRLGLEDAVNELIHDDAVDFFALGAVGTHVLHSARLELFRIDLALDEISSSGQAEAPEPARDRLGGDDLGDVEPGQR